MSTPTRYELTLSNGTTTYLVCYSMRKSRSSLYHIACKWADRIKKVTGTVEIIFAQTVAGGGRLGDWTLKFSGRTQRDAQYAGEHPWLGDVPLP